MKKILVAATLMVITTIASAHGYYNNRGYRGHGYNGYNNGQWVAPLVIGGILGYAASQPNYYAPPPVYYAPPPPPVYYEQRPQNCVQYIIQDQYGNFIRQETRCN